MNSRGFSMLHNEAAKYVLNNLTGIPATASEVKSTVLSLNIDFCNKYGIAFPGYTLPDYPQNPNDIDVRVWIAQSSNSATLKQYLNLTVDVLEAEKTYEETRTDFQALLDNAQQALSAADYALYEDHISVALSSMMFWTATIDGTPAWKREVVKFPLPPQPTYLINWWKVFAVDCVGGMVGGPAGYLGSSTISVIMQS